MLRWTTTIQTFQFQYDVITRVFRKPGFQISILFVMVWAWEPISMQLNILLNFYVVKIKTYREFSNFFLFFYLTRRTNLLE